MDIDALARQVQEQAHLHAIANLKAHYCWLLETRRTDEAAALFTEDGVWDGGEVFGRHEGRDAVRGYFARIQESGLSFCLHGVLTPFVELRGEGRAFGRWYLSMPCTLRDADGRDRAVLGGAWYEDDFVLGGDGVWRVREMKVTNHFWSPLDKGWVEERFLAT